MVIGDSVTTTSNVGWGLDYAYPKISGVIIAIEQQQYSGRRGLDTIITFKTAEGVVRSIEKRCLEVVCREL